MYKKIILINVLAIIRLCTGFTQYIYGNLIKPNGLKKYSINEIDELIYNISNRVKTYDELKHNFTQIQIQHITTGFILNSEFYNDLKFVEDVIVNKKLLETSYDINYFDDIIHNMKSIENVSRKLYEDENLLYNNKSYLDINFNYYLWEKFLSDNSKFQYNIIDKLKMVIYNTRSDLDFILKKINWYTNELAKYNPDIHNNYINSVVELFKLKQNINQHYKYIDNNEL